MSNQSDVLSWYQVHALSLHSGHVLLGLFRLFLFWNSNNRIHRISVPIKQIVRYSENRVADVIKRDQCGRAIFPPKYYSVHSAIGSRMDRIAFCSFWNRNSFQKNTSTIWNWNKQNSPKRTCPQCGSVPLTYSSPVGS